MFRNQNGTYASHETIQAMKKKKFLAAQFFLQTTFVIVNQIFNIISIALLNVASF